MINKVKPVLRYPGSKYNKIEKIIELLKMNDQNENFIFVDVFGGSGIVGVNVKANFPNSIVNINDYDKILKGGINDTTALKNMLSFQGMGNTFTKMALEYFNNRVKNGYWEKLEKYNEILKECDFSTYDMKKDLYGFLNRIYYNCIFSAGLARKKVKLYIDPPYPKVKKLYAEDWDIEDIKKLAKDLRHAIPDFEILISLNDTPEVREIFKDWTIIEELFTYSTMSKNKGEKRAIINELFITNKIK